MDNSKKQLHIELVSEVPKETSKLIRDKFYEYTLEKLGPVQRLRDWGLILTENNKLIGIISGRINLGALHLKEFLILPEHRGKGFGNFLLKKALEFGKKENCRFAFLETYNFQAPNFYKKFGFEIEFERKGYDKNCRFIYLRKNL